MFGKGKNAALVGCHWVCAFLIARNAPVKPEMFVLQFTGADYGSGSDSTGNRTIPSGSVQSEEESHGLLRP